MDPAGAEPLLGQGETGAAAPEQAFLRNPAAGVPDLAVRRPAFSCMAHHRNVAHQLEASGVARDDDHRSAQMRRGIGIGHRHHHRESGAVRRAGEPFVAVDDPLSAFEDRARIHPGGIRPGMLRLRHREAAADFAGPQRAQPALFLLLAAGELEQLHVADVGRLRVHAIVPERAVAQFLREDGKLLQRNLQVGNPEPQRPGARPRLAQRRLQRLPRSRQPRLERHDLASHELARPRAQLLGPFRE